MVNSVTFYQIISKIDDGTTFIIVGDDGQLPAIGAGNILGDCIEFQLAPIVKLTKLYRQNDNQAIALIANEIRQGNLPKYNGKYNDFSFIDISIPNYFAIKNTISKQELSLLRNKNSHEILDNILDISTKHLKHFKQLLKDKEIQKYLVYFQVITPMKHGILGVENLNIKLQDIFNQDNKNQLIAKRYRYKQGDKVIHIKNENMKIQTIKMYKDNSENMVEKRVFNGMLGIIIKLDFNTKKAVVLYPNDDMVVFYSFDECDYLISLAYALTIHKTQGMEYNTALIPISYSHFIMHNTKLFYTAITRAKSMCYIVGESTAFESGCKNIKITQRESVIQDLLKNKD